MGAAAARASPAVRSEEALALVGADDSAAVRLVLDGAGVEIDSVAGAKQPAPPPCQRGGGCTLPDRRKEKDAPESVVGEVGHIGKNSLIMKNPDLILRKSILTKNDTITQHK
jgi:hypothetical protein